MIKFMFMKSKIINYWLIPAKIVMLLLLFLNCNKPHSANKSASILDTITNESVEHKKLLRHVVLFKFKDSASADDITKVIEAFADLPNKIPDIKGFEWGINNSPENLDKGFTHSFILTFDSEEGRENYLPHPDHKAFGDIVGPVLDDVLVIDYWTED